LKTSINDYLGNILEERITSNGVNQDWTAPSVSATRNTYQCTNQDVRINIVASDNIC
jgi:hypothetical protein